MHRWYLQRRPVTGALLALVWLLASCGGSTAPPVATIAAAPLPADWQPVELPAVTFALPPEWSVTRAEDLDFGPAATEMAGQNPQLQALLDQGRAALSSGEVQLIAYDLDLARGDPSGFPANLRVGQQIFAEAPSMHEVADVNERQLRETAAFTNVDRAAVMVGPTPATRLRSNLRIIDVAGQPLDLALEQYLLMEDTTLVIVTLTSTVGQQPLYRPIYDNILATLQLKAQP